MEPTPKIPDLLVWVDLETTGLEAERESILEIACIVTDSALQPIATFCAITNAARYHAIALLDPVVQAMHTRSGLWDASMSAPRGQAQVAAEFRDFLDAHLPTVEVDGKPRRVAAQLAGSTISFDRSFLRQHMRAAHDLPALPEPRRLDPERGRAPVLAGRVRHAARRRQEARGRRAPCARRHRGVDRVPAALPRADRPEAADRPRRALHGRRADRAGAVLMGATDKSVLLAQWRHDSKTYRMVSVGTWSRGFEDELVVEREDSDTLGGSRWVEVDRWRPGGIDGARDIRSVLAAGVKAAMSPRRRAPPRAPRSSRRRCIQRGWRAQRRRPTTTSIRCHESGTAGVTIDPARRR
jgi:oligoribonuclease (3'-5' exoribonuclease)